jgi:hypothetical protein
MTSQQLTLDATAPYQNYGAEGLPLITDRASDRILVYTPGHLYAPSPVEVDRIGRAAGPGALIATERKFIASLIRYLDPDHARNEDVIVSVHLPLAVTADFPPWVGYGTL